MSIQSFWFFAFALVAFGPLSLGLVLIRIDFLPARLFGFGLVAASPVPVLIMTNSAFPRMTQWFDIAAGLTFGRTELADRKEAELLAAIAKESAQGPHH